MKNTNKLYIAYGSNLHLGQMEFRCPYATPLGTTELEGYRLLFRGGGSGNAVATVEPMEGSSVPVLLWEITPRDEEALDHYEGWPRLYRKETVTVKHKGKAAEAMVYIMNDIYPLGLPGDYYLGIIKEGYESAGFDFSVLDEAVAASEPRGQWRAVQIRECYACSHSFSEPAESEDGEDRLFCMERQEYVTEDYCCDDFN